MKTHCEICLCWPDGDTQKIGRMDFEFNKSGMEGKPVRNVQRRFGWAMVRHGIRMILRGAKEDA